ncbi:MAG TPA: DUF4397 domain-containing protein [Terriglobales bacterium]|nr:DUF4397 domain-containing protein [Terriglobales bacterium]
MLKSLLLALAVAALSLITISCNPSSTAQVRFVHAIEDAGALDIEINDSKIFSDVSFTDLQPLTGYKGAPSGVDTMTGVVSGTTTEAFFVPNVKLFEGNEYTVVATGTVVNTDSAVVLVSLDNDNVPNNGTVNFRFINAAPDGPATGVDIYVMPAQEPLQSPPTVSGLNYQQTSAYINVPYNKQGSGFVIYVCTTGTTTPLFSQALSVGGPTQGVIRTLILTDQQKVEALNPLFVVLNDVN